MYLGAQGPVSISEKMSYRKISWSLEAAGIVFSIVRSLWNLTGPLAALLPMCLSNFKVIRQFEVAISWLRDFTRSYEKTSFRILRRGPGRFSTMAQVLACCETAPSPCLNQFWLSNVYLVKQSPRRQWCVWLTHWGRDKMAAIAQTTVSNAFSWMKIHEFRFKFPWNLFQRAQLTIFSAKPLSEPMIARSPTHICVTRPQWVE